MPLKPHCSHSYKSVRISGVKDRRDHQTAQYPETAKANKYGATAKPVGEQANRVARSYRISRPATRRPMCPLERSVSIPAGRRPAVGYKLKKGSAHNVKRKSYLASRLAAMSGILGYGRVGSIALKPWHSICKSVTERTFNLGSELAPTVTQRQRSRAISTTTLLKPSTSTKQASKSLPVCFASVPSNSGTKLEIPVFQSVYRTDRSIKARTSPKSCNLARETTTSSLASKESTLKSTSKKNECCAVCNALVKLYRRDGEKVMTRRALEFQGERVRVQIFSRQFEKALVEMVSSNIPDSPQEKAVLLAKIDTIKYSLAVKFSALGLTLPLQDTAHFIANIAVAFHAINNARTLQSSARFIALDGQHLPSAYVSFLLMVCRHATDDFKHVQLINLVDVFAPGDVPSNCFVFNSLVSKMSNLATVYLNFEYLGRRLLYTLGNFGRRLKYLGIKFSDYRLTAEQGQLTEDDWILLGMRCPNLNIDIDYTTRVVDDSHLKVVIRSGLPISHISLSAALDDMIGTFKISTLFQTIIHHCSVTLETMDLRLETNKVFFMGDISELLYTCVNLRELYLFMYLPFFVIASLPDLPKRNLTSLRRCVIQAICHSDFDVALIEKEARPRYQELDKYGVFYDVIPVLRGW